MKNDFVFALVVFSMVACSPTYMHPPESSEKVALEGSFLEFVAKATYESQKKFNVTEDASKMLWIEHVIMIGTKEGYIKGENERNWIRSFYSDKLFKTSRLLTQEEIRSEVANYNKNNPVRSVGKARYTLRDKDIRFMGYDTYRQDNDLCYRSKLVWDGSKWLPNVSYYNKAVRLKANDDHPAILYISLLESPKDNGRALWEEDSPVDWPCNRELAWSKYNDILKILRK